MTFGDKMALHLDGEDIEVGKFPPRTPTAISISVFRRPT
jgi:hypothetical protein